MKKIHRFFLPAALLAVLLALVWYFRPLPLNTLLDGDSSISISCQTLYLKENGDPDFRFEQYSLDPGTAEYRAAAAVLAQYSYHRNLGTLWDYLTSSATIEKAGSFTMSLSTTSHTLTLAGVRQIMLDSAGYSVGWWGDRQAQDLLAALQQILAGTAAA